MVMSFLLHFLRFSDEFLNITIKSSNSVVTYEKHEMPPNSKKNHFSTVLCFNLLFLLFNQKFYLVNRKISIKQLLRYSFLPHVHPPAHCASKYMTKLWINMENSLKKEFALKFDGGRKLEFCQGQ